MVNVGKNIPYTENLGLATGGLPLSTEPNSCLKFLRLSGFNWAFRCGNAEEIARPRCAENATVDMLSISISYQLFVLKTAPLGFLYSLEVLVCWKKS